MSRFIFVGSRGFYIYPVKDLSEGGIIMSAVEEYYNIAYDEWDRLELYVGRKV